MELKNSFPIKWITQNPRISAWVVLSLGMIILLVIEAHDVGLTIGNWIALIIATVLVAGACIWIVSWEDVDDSDGNSPTETGTYPKVPLPPRDDDNTAEAVVETVPDEVLPQ
jgi:hypothetical protein